MLARVQAKPGHTQAAEQEEHEQHDGLKPTDAKNVAPLEPRASSLACDATFLASVCARTFLSLGYVLNAASTPAFAASHDNPCPRTAP